MPGGSRASKRTLEEIVLKDDSNDEDYDDRAPGPTKSRSSRTRRGEGPLRKKQKRGGYRGSDVDSDDEEVESDDDEGSFDESSDNEVQTNERGRPIRKSAKKEITYEESPSEEEDELSRSSSEDSEQVTPVKKRRLIVKLKTGLTPLSKSNPPTRALRTRSGSYGLQQQPSSAQPPSRRSSRLSHDPDEPVIALTNSGNHVEIVRAGSHDLEGIPARALKGGKGLKYPSKSTIDEGEEPDSVRTKQEETNELEIEASQHEILESGPPTPGGGEEEVLPKIMSDIHEAANFVDEDQVMNDDGTDPLHMDAEDEDDDEGPVSRGRTTRQATKRQIDSPLPASDTDKRQRRRILRSAAAEGESRSRRRKAPDESSDFDPQDEQDREENMSSSSESQPSQRKVSRGNGDDDSSNNGRRSNRLRSKAVSRQRSPLSDEEEDLAAEVAELKRDGKKKRPSRDEIIFEPRGARRAGKKPNYDLLRNLAPIEDDEDPAPSPSQRARKPGGGSWQRSLFSTYGPFGGAGGAVPVLGGFAGPRAQGDVDSDSSDDEVMKQPRPSMGGTVGMTPTTAGGFNLFPPTLNTDPAQATAGTPANLGKIKDKQALADADPLGVDQNVNFDGVGGLQGHIDQLKEMVALPLLYPEIFMRFHITPPRGVLFHGPPGTGKTLLARALASSVSSQGRKVTFYMRKGADALSKWVGEAERQLRLLFEEARKTQPSIIFFDEIDGLAPVRSSKQEQIHASIVSTLLALMDGMDGRGQVIVIGATNRPDSIDPALRRPGRFDREFYFPLPGTEARRAILDIHTKGWNPPLDASVKDELAELTKGYGGADLRALCTEAALNAVQRRYPQIYSSNEKLLIDPKTIEVTPKDFMISVKKMVPSSERSTSSGAAPLPGSVEPLLRKPLAQIKEVLAGLLPQKKPLTALQEAQYEDVADGAGFGRERMQQVFESTRVFRPRLLIHGKTGMGQQYLAAALLNHFEGLHVQSFDLPTLLSDTASSPEATVIRLFAEVKMHKPSVIYIPNVEEWYASVGPTVVTTFLGLLRSIKPTDPVLLLGVVETDADHVDEGVRRELFGFSTRNQFFLNQPSQTERLDFFFPLKAYIRTSPADFPDPDNRKKRQLEQLKPAPPEPRTSAAPTSKEEQKAQKKRDRQTLNMLKIRLQPIMDQIRTRHRKFRAGVIDESQIRYLYDEADPGTVTSDLHTDLLARASFRPFEIGKDQHGVPGLVEQSTMRFYYNLDSVTIEKRLSNGYYKRPKDFLADIKRLAKDAKTVEDEDRLLKANELLANVEVDIGGIELGEPAFTAECERVYQRELQREKEAIEKAKAAAENNKDMPPPQVVSNVPHGESGPSTMAPSDGPVFLGEPTSRGRDLLSRFQLVTPSRPASHSTVITNGIHISATAMPEGEMRNGSTSPDGGHEADVEGDTEMGGTDSQLASHEKSNETQHTHTTSSFGNRESAQPRPFHSYTAPSQQLRKESGMSAPLSQTGGITPMAAGSQAADYQNDASTTQTTSGKKNSGPSTGEKDHTQDTGPNLYLYDERRSAGGSEIPDTQDDPGEPPYSQGSATGFDSNPSQPLSRQSRPPSSQGPDRSSQPPVPPFEAPIVTPQQHPPRPNGHLENLLNPPPQPNLVQVEEGKLENMRQDIAYKTSGLSVEQLEQVNSVLMDTLWRTKSEWDRSKVLDQVADAFNAVMEDMQEAGQDFGVSSWGRVQI